MRLAFRDWRIRFSVDGARITVDAIATGYRERQLVEETGVAIERHRAFVAKFGR